MDAYQELNVINESKQKELDEFKNIHNALNKAEDALREKIILRYQELEMLSRDYNNIIETYSHIIRSSIRTPKNTSQ